MECDMLLLDRRTQSLVEDYVPSGEILEGIVCFFSIFSDSTRVRILSALAITEMCVTDLSRVLSINQTTVSHQLRFLKNVGIVKTERHGKIIFYSLKNETVNDVPSPGLLLTVMVPPWPSAIAFASGSPSPIPWVSSEFLLR